MEEQYIPFGQDQIDVQEMNKLLANSVESYLNSKRWTPEQKNKWRAAYSDLMDRGIIGISTDGGRYSIDHNGVPFVDTEGYYGDVANFISNTVAPIAKKKEEEKKVELPKYNLDQDFTSYFMNQYYGGTGGSNFENFQNTWSNLDKADKYGIRGTDVRRGRLKEALQNYVTYLDENKDKYNYDNGVFKNLDDLKGRLNAAIRAMDTPNQQDDIDTLNALGIRPDFLDTGANRTVTLTDGTQMTASQYRDYDLKQQAKLASNKQAQANQFKKYRSIPVKNLNGTPPTGQNVLERLNGYYSLGNLNAQQQSELIGAFKFAERNNALKPLSKEELAALGSFRGANRLRKIDGLNRFYWDSAGQRIVQPFMNSDDGTQSFQDLVNQKDPKLLQEQNRQKTDQRKLSEGFKTEDFLRMGAMAQDITGAIAAWAPTYGTAISGGLGLTSLATNFIADWNDDSVTAGDMFKNAGINLALGAVGLVPGLGAAAKSGKWLANIAKWTPRILTLAQAGHIVLSDDIKNSLKKASSISDWNELTNHDVKNIVYALSTAAGLSRGAKGFVNDRNFKPAFTENNKKQYTVTTSKGKKVVTEEQVNEIKKLNPKDKEKYNEELKKILKLEDNETFDTKNISFFGKELKNKGIEIKEENIPTGLSSRAKAYREYLENKNNQSKENHRLLSKYIKTDYDIYKSNTQRNIPELSISDRIKNIWNPLSDRNLQKRGIKIEETPKTSTQQKVSQQSNQQQSNQPQTSKITPEVRKNVQKAKKEMEQILNPTKSRKAIKTKNGKADIEVNIGEEKLKINYDRNSNELNINGKKYQVKNGFEVRQKVLAEIQNIRNNSRIQARNTKSINKFKISIEELKKLKKQGFLKQGGKIDNPSVDDIINNYFKNKQI